LTVNKKGQITKNGLIESISRGEAVEQIGDDNAECVLVVAGFNRDGVAHVHDFLS
jgi:hypothetical protein